METTNQVNEQEEKIILEAKVQTIYFEDTQGEILKHLHVSNNRLNIKQAEEVLKEEGTEINLVLRVVTDRINVALTREELTERIINSERFYQQKN